MPEALIGEAGRSILDVGVIGAVCLLLIAAIVWHVRISRADLKAEREAHKATLDAYLKSIKEYASIGESIRDQMAASEATMRAVLDVVKERRT